MTLAAARPPLVAFNVELEAPATVDDARAIAAAIREGGEEGLPGVRAIGLELPARGGVAQVSLNVEDHGAAPLATVVAADRAGTRPSPRPSSWAWRPQAAFDGFPSDLPRAQPPDCGGGPGATKPKRPHGHEEAPDQAPRQRRRPGGRPRQHGQRPLDGLRSEASPRARPRASAAQNRFDQPPSWRSSLNRALIATVIFAVVIVAFFGQPTVSAIPLAVFMLVIYVPMGYYTDQFFYRRRQRQKAAAREH